MIEDTQDEETLGLPKGKDTWDDPKPAELKEAEARMNKLIDDIDALRGTHANPHFLRVNHFEFRFIVVVGKPAPNVPHPQRQIHCVFYHPTTRKLHISQTDLWDPPWAIAGELTNLAR